MKIFLLLGAVFGCLGVVLGAFGAHGLKPRLAPEMLTVFEVGVRYQLYHALALLVVGWFSGQHEQLFISLSGWFFTLGIIIFSGSLYILSLTGMKSWGGIAPIGALFLILGWVALIGSFMRL
jgi:uncharacterized membrane protein YgdD (TMEM256/DUF423 family)